MYFNYDIRLYFPDLKFWLLSIIFLSYSIVIIFNILFNQIRAHDIVRLMHIFSSLVYKFFNSSKKNLSFQEFFFIRNFLSRNFFCGENEFYKITDKKRERKKENMALF